MIEIFIAFLVLVMAACTLAIVYDHGKKVGYEEGDDSRIEKQYASIFNDGFSPWTGKPWLPGKDLFDQGDSYTFMMGGITGTVRKEFVPKIVAFYKELKDYQRLKEYDEGRQKELDASVPIVDVKANGG